MKNKIFINIVIALVLVLGIQNLYSGDVSRLGTAAGVQTIIPVGARYLAVAGANIATVEGLDGLHWNPAGLANLNNSASSVFSTMSIFNDVDVNYLGLAFKAGDFGNIAFTLKAIDFGDIPVTTALDPDGDAGGKFSPTFLTIGITYSSQLTDVIQVGITTKFISESIDRVSASAFAIDAGIQYRGIAGFSGLSFGLVIKNIGTSMQYAGPGLRREGRTTDGTFNDFFQAEASVDDLPTSFEIGLGYNVDINEQSVINFSSTFSNFNFGSDAFRLGVEYVFDDMIALRGGFLDETDTDAKDQLYSFTLGAGFHYNLGGTDLTLDYSFRDSQYFDGNNLFSLKLGF